MITPNTKGAPSRSSSSAAASVASAPPGSASKKSQPPLSEPEPHHHSLSIWTPLERAVDAVDAPPPQGYESVIDALHDALRRQHKPRHRKPAPSSSSDHASAALPTAPAAAVAAVPAYARVRPSLAEVRCLKRFLKCGRLFERFENASATVAAATREKISRCCNVHARCQGLFEHLLSGHDQLDAAPRARILGLFSQILESSRDLLAGDEWIGQLAGATHLRRVMSIRPPPITQALAVEGLAKRVLVLLSASSASEVHEILLLRELARALIGFTYVTSTPEQKATLQRLCVGPALVRCLGRATADEELAAELLQCLCNLPTDTLMTAAPLPVLLRHVNANHARGDRGDDGGDAINAAKAQSRKLDVQRRLCVLLRKIIGHPRTSLADLLKRHPVPSAATTAAVADISAPAAAGVSMLDALTSFMLHSSDPFVLEDTCNAWTIFLEDAPSHSDEQKERMKAMRQAAAEDVTTAATPAADGQDAGSMTMLLTRFVQLSAHVHEPHLGDEADFSGKSEEEMDALFEDSLVAEAALGTLWYIADGGSHSEHAQLLDLGLLPILLRYLRRVASIKPQRRQKKADASPASSCDASEAGDDDNAGYTPSGAEAGSASFNSAGILFRLLSSSPALCRRILGIAQDANTESDVSEEDGGGTFKVLAALLDNEMLKAEHYALWDEAVECVCAIANHAGDTVLQAQLLRRVPSALESMARVATRAPPVYSDDEYEDDSEEEQAEEGEDEEDEEEEEEEEATPGDAATAAAAAAAAAKKQSTATESNTDAGKQQHTPDSKPSAGGSTTSADHAAEKEKKEEEDEEDDEDYEDPDEIKLRCLTLRALGSLLNYARECAPSGGDSSAITATTAVDSPWAVQRFSSEATSDDAAKAAPSSKQQQQPSPLDFIRQTLQSVVSDDYYCTEEDVDDPSSADASVANSDGKQSGASNEAKGEGGEKKEEEAEEDEYVHRHGSSIAESTCPTDIARRLLASHFPSASARSDATDSAESAPTGASAVADGVTKTTKAAT
jgi:hypothetical protein